WASLAAEPVQATTPKSPLLLPFMAREHHPLGESQLPTDLLQAIRQRLSKLLPSAPARLTISLTPLGPSGAKGGGERRALVFNAAQESPTQDGRHLTHLAHLTL